VQISSWNRKKYCSGLVGLTVMSAMLQQRKDKDHKQASASSMEGSKKNAITTNAQTSQRGALIGWEEDKSLPSALAGSEDAKKSECKPSGGAMEGESRQEQREQVLQRVLARRRRSREIGVQESVAHGDKLGLMMRADSTMPKARLEESQNDTKSSSLQALGPLNGTSTSFEHHCSTINTDNVSIWPICAEAAVRESR
jgi:hypothetical protein